jgi:anti-anti-sigma factor
MSTKPEFASHFEIDEHGRVCVVTLKGHFDPTAVEELHPQIQELVDAGFKRYVFDLSQLQHVGSLGLRLLVGLHNQVKPDGGVALYDVSSKVQSILDLTKVHQVLRTYRTRHEAIDAVKSR